MTNAIIDTYTSTTANAVKFEDGYAMSTVNDGDLIAISVFTPGNDLVALEKFATADEMRAKAELVRKLIRTYGGAAYARMTA